MNSIDKYKDNRWILKASENAFVSSVYFAAYRFGEIDLSCSEKRFEILAPSQFATLELCAPTLFIVSSST